MLTKPKKFSEAMAPMQKWMLDSVKMLEDGDDKKLVQIKQLTEKLEKEKKATEEAKLQLTEGLEKEKLRLKKELEKEKLQLKEELEKVKKANAEMAGTIKLVRDNVLQK